MSRVGGTLHAVVLKIAEGLGVEDLTTSDNGRAMPPSDAHDRDLCIRLFNDAQNSLVQAFPRWRCLVSDVSLTLDSAGDGPRNIDSDATKYILPESFRGQTPTFWTWRYEAGNYGGTAAATHMGRVNGRLANDTSTGSPQLIAVDTIRATTAGGGRTDGWYLRVYPTPDLAYTISARCKVEATPLTELSERHVWGQMFDRLLADVAIAIGEKKPLPADAINAAIRHDQAGAAPSLGQMTDPSVIDDEDDVPVYQRSGSISYNGVAVN